MSATQIGASTDAIVDSYVREHQYRSDWPPSNLYGPQRRVRARWFASVLSLRREILSSYGARPGDGEGVRLFEM